MLRQRGLYKKNISFALGFTHCNSKVAWKAGFCNGTKCVNNYQSKYNEFLTWLCLESSGLGRALP